MFDLKRVATEYGKEWMVIADTPGFGSGVVVPEGGTEGLTDEQIGREVRRLMREARLLNARVWADLIMTGSGYQFGNDEIIELLADFKGEDEKVAAAYYRKIEIRRSEQASAGRKYDREMKKRVGRGYAAAFRRVTELEGYACGRCGRGGRGEGAVSLHLAYKESVTLDQQANPAHMLLICDECL
jgi:hypothetical protein